MGTEQREAIMCVLDALAEGIEELRALLLDGQGVAESQVLRLGDHVIDAEGAGYYITGFTERGVVGVGVSWVPNTRPVALDGFTVAEEVGSSQTPVEGLWRVLTPDGWGVAYYNNARGWGSVGWTEEFALQYRDTPNRACPIIRAFPLQDA